MNQSPRKFSFSQGLLFGGAIATLATGSLLAPGLSPSVRAALEDSPKTVVDEVWQIVNKEFVDGNFNQVDWHTMRQELLSRNYTNRKEAYKAIRQALKTLGDSYTRFLAPAEFEVLTSQTSGELSGVGIRLTIDGQTNYLTVIEPVENSPAMKAGIKAGDKILKIDGKPTALMSLEQASEEIRGEVGTDVRLQISRQGEELFELTLTRSQIELPSVSYTLKRESQMQVGYIKLDEFSSHSAEQMKQAIKDLNDKQVSAFVLDLRGNPGGLLFASIEIARMWMEDGTIVSIVDRKGGDKKFSANGTALTDLPLVVLVNGNSASASEILAGALKENGRATVIGTSTFGKGTVQSLHTLSDGSGLAVTISRYYPPSGINITKKGIAPDIYLDLTMEQQLRLRNNPSLIGTSADPQYARAIAVLTEPISIR
ncbi:MAG: carboxyl-terminal processing protease CtpB [Xenococcaceae cyanobacterium]